jgi:hypothetical protein
MACARVRHAILTIGCLAAGIVFAGVDANAAPTPYQAAAYAQCPTGTNCKVAFPAVPASSRLDVQFVACQIRSATSADVANTRFYLQTTQSGKTVALALASVAPGTQSDGTNVYSAVSQPVVFSVPAGQKLQIFAWPSKGTFIDRIDCTVAGAMVAASSPPPYQASAYAQCPTGINCKVAFPAVPASSRLDVQFVACEIRSASNSDVIYTRFYLQTTQSGKTVALDLASVAPYYQSDGTYVYSAVSQPVVFFVPAGQKLDIFAWPTTGQFIDRIDCTVAGQIAQ